MQFFISGFGTPLRLDREKQITGKVHGHGACIYINKRWWSTNIIRVSLCKPDIELVAVSLRPSLSTKRISPAIFYSNLHRSQSPCVHCLWTYRDCWRQTGTDFTWLPQMCICWEILTTAPWKNLSKDSSDTSHVPQISTQFLISATLVFQGPANLCPSRLSELLIIIPFCSPLNTDQLYGEQRKWSSLLDSRLCKALTRKGGVLNLGSNTERFGERIFATTLF